MSTFYRSLPEADILAFIVKHPEQKIYYDLEVVLFNKRFILIGYVEIFNMDVNTEIDKPLTIVSEGRHFIPIVIETVLGEQRTTIGSAYTTSENRAATCWSFGNNLLETIISGQVIAVFVPINRGVVWKYADEV